MNNEDRITAIESADHLLMIGTQKGQLYCLPEGEKHVKQITNLSFRHSIQCIAVTPLVATQKLVAVGSWAGELAILRCDNSDSFTLQATIPQNNAVSALHWLTNSERLNLLIGDSKGMVFNAVLDTSTFELKHSTTLIEESHEIAQITSHSSHVLVATLKRVVIIHNLQPNTPTQIGVQERKILGPFGASFIVSNNNGNQQDTMLITSRPGLRLWVADTSGKVQSTFLYKDAFQQTYPVRYLVPDTAVKPQLQFGPLFFLEPYLYTYSSSSLFILQPWELKIVLVLHSDASGIRRVTISNDTLFVLTGLGQIFAVALPSLDCQPFPLVLAPPPAPETFKIPVKTPLPNKVWDEARQTLSKITEVGSTALKEVNSKVKIPGLNEGPFILDALGSVMSPLLKSDLKTRETPSMSQSLYSPVSSVSSPSTSPDSLMSQSLYETQRQLSLQKTLQRKEAFERISNLQYETPLFAQMPKKKLAKKRFLPDNVSISSEESDASVLSDRNPVKNVEIPRSTLVAPQMSPDSGQGVEIPELEEEISASETKTKSIRDFDQEELDRKQKLVEEMLNLAEFLSPDPDSAPVVAKEDERSKDLSRVEIGIVEDGLDCEHPTPKMKDETRKVELQSQMSHFEDFYTPYLKSRHKIAESDVKIQESDVKAIDADVKFTGSSSQSQSSHKSDEASDIRNSSEVRTKDFFFLGENREDHYANQTNTYAKRFTEEEKLKEDIDDVILNMDEQYFSSSLDHERKCTSWIQLNGPVDHPITSLAVQDHFIYCTDSSSQVFRAPIQHSFCFKWSKLNFEAQCLAISPSGNLVVMLHKNVAYRAIHDIGSGVGEWLTLERNVTSLAVKDDSVWMIQPDSIVIRSGLNRHNPIGHLAAELPNDLRLIQVAMYEGIVWGLSRYGKVYYRLGITPVTPGGFSWHELDFLVDLPSSTASESVTNQRESLIKVSKNVTPHFVHLALTPRGVALGVDAENRVYWTSGISKQYPEGRDRCWWQVIMHNEDSEVEAPAKKLQVVTSKLVSTLKTRLNPFGGKSGPFLLFAEDRLWFCEASSAVIWKSRDSVVGFRWEAWQWKPPGGQDLPTPPVATVPSINSNWNTSLATVLSLSPYPASMYATLPGPLSTTEVLTGWKCVHAGAMYKQLGVLWLYNYKNELFVWIPGHDLKEVELPFNEKLRCLAAAPESCWVVTHSGAIYIRSGISQNNLSGEHWVQLTNIQIGNSIEWTSVALGFDIAWACDNKGQIWLRLGPLSPPALPNLAPAWVRVEDHQQLMKNQHIVFSQVYIGACPHIVWALDRSGKIYVREGVYPELPIGTSWVQVPPIQAVQLALSDSAVWALSTNGEVYRRYGITSTNFVGDEWRKIPGEMSTISVSVSDDLWGLRNGILHRHELASVDFSQGPKKDINSETMDTEWEFV